MPTFICTCLLAHFVSSIFRGSTTTSLAPFFTARFIRNEMTGCDSVVFEPVTSRKSEPASSSMEFDMAPLPTMTARPATVGACQVRLQLSMLFVPIATRANFCIR